MTTVRCDRVVGRGTCRAVMVEDCSLMGRVTWHCPLCARKARHLCRTCPRATPSRWHTYCAPCAQRIKTTRDRKANVSPDMLAWRQQYSKHRHQQQRQDPAQWATRLQSLRENKRKRREAAHGVEYCETHGPGHAGRVLPRKRGQWVRV
jgi:hypothetical protein